jgi:hypothetical protein
MSDFYSGIKLQNGNEIDYSPEGIALYANNNSLKIKDNINRISEIGFKNTKHRFYHCNHFFHNSALSQDGVCLLQTVGTGNTINPSFSQINSLTTPVPGALRLSAGTCNVSATRCNYHTQNSAGFDPLYLNSNYFLIYETSVLIGNQSNTTTNNFYAQLGFGEGLANVSTVGASFLYNETNRTNASANWQVQTGNGTTQTRQATSVPVVFGDFYDLKIELTSSFAKFYINDVLVATITTNLPVNTFNPSTSFGFGNNVIKQGIVPTDTTEAYIDMNYVILDFHFNYTP